ncbi:MAG: NADH-quinone oxidoreductase subunit N [Planctomycetota bacterium]|jgi:NADH-quinone oxidoreductase subunit N|nr:NADH-quinone oxidoreductase subunit N [Planctomycetota bacterium]MDA1200720.1 NADH-quinone oxidoreductase subunit N [Planctomycetota bacterium]
MDLGSLVSGTINDTVRVSLPLFRVELVIAVSVVLVLLARMLPVLRWLDSGLVALGGACFATWYGWADLQTVQQTVPQAGGFREELFGGLLVFDSLTATIRLLLAAFLALYIVFTKVSGIPDREDGADFYVLVLGATLGMCLMASANHLLMVFMAVEMASVPSYALAGFLKGRKAASEAALKYAVYGAGAAGIMLYGISLLAGVLGTCHLPSMAAEMGRIVGEGKASGEIMVLSLGGLMLAVGLAFKLSAVPFHFWCPDVFEGAAAEIGAFLSVASKAAAVALAVRLVFGLGTVADGAAAGAVAAGLADVRHFMVYVVGLMAVATCTLGNLAAYGQTNMKRLLAYSTVAHAGYLMMGVAAAGALAGVDAAGAQRAVAALAFYLGTYLFMNLAAFAIVAVLRNRLRSEEIASYAGLVRTNPGIVVATTVVLVSLIGLPPLAGFVAKFLIFSSLVKAIASTAESPLMLVILIVGGINTVISLFYYLRVLKVMTFDSLPEDRVAEPAGAFSLAGGLVAALAVPVVLFGILWSGLYGFAQLAGSFAS